MTLPLIPSLRCREHLPEMMDDPTLDPEAHRWALQGLARINRFSGSAQLLLPALLKAARQYRNLRVLDLATGSGDIPITLKRLLTRFGYPEVEFFACDISETALSSAKAQVTGKDDHVEFFQHDLFRSELREKFDIVLCCLFLHHLSDDDALSLLQRANRLASSMVLINDLFRSQWNYWIVWSTCRILTRSPIVHVDGPRSVQAAFSLAEVRRLVADAGIKNGTLSIRRPCRFLLEWTPS